MIISKSVLCFLFYNRQYGALTSKDYEFKARPWEIQSAIFFDKTEIGNPKIRIDFRDLKVLRVLPQIIPGQVNWITDRTRFYYSGYNTNRLLQCNFKLDNSYFILSSINLHYWLQFLILKIKNYIQKISINYFFEHKFNFVQNFCFLIYYDVLMQLKIILNLKNLLNKTGLKNNISQKVKNDFVNFSNLDLKSLIKNLKKIFIVNLDIRLSFPKLYLFIRNQTRVGGIVYTLGTKLDYKFNNFFLGTKINLLKKILAGKHWLTSDVLLNHWKMFINDNLCKINFKLIKNVIYLMVNNCIEMSNFFGLTSQTNILLNKFHKNWVSNKILILIFQNNKMPELKKNAIKIFVGSHAPESFDFVKLNTAFNIQIPLLSPIEQDDCFLSNTGKWFKTTKIISRMEFFFFDNFFSISKTVLLNHLTEIVELRCYLKNVIKQSIIFFDKTGFLFNLPPRASEVLNKLQLLLKKTKVNYSE